MILCIDLRHCSLWNPHAPLIYNLNVAVNEAAAILARAKRPVIVLGSQAVLPPVPADTLRAKLEVRLIYDNEV